MRQATTAVALGGYLPAKYGDIGDPFTNAINLWLNVTSGAKVRLFTWLLHACAPSRMRYWLPQVFAQIATVSHQKLAEVVCAELADLMPTIVVDDDLEVEQVEEICGADGVVPSVASLDQLVEFRGESRSEQVSAAATSLCLCRVLLRTLRLALQVNNMFPLAIELLQAATTSEDPPLPHCAAAHKW